MMLVMEYVQIAALPPALHTVSHSGKKVHKLSRRSSDLLLVRPFK